MVATTFMLKQIVILWNFKLLFQCVFRAGSQVGWYHTETNSTAAQDVRICAGWWQGFSFIF